MSLMEDSEVKPATKASKKKLYFIIYVSKINVIYVFSSKNLLGDILKLFLSFHTIDFIPSYLKI